MTMSMGNYDVQPEPLPTAPEALSPSFNTQLGIYQNLSKLRPPDNDQPLLMPFDLNGLVAGTVLTLNTDAGVPDSWIVSIRPVANSKVSVFAGPENSGIPYRLGGGGSLTIPGLNEYLTIVVEAGSAAIVGTVVALRNYKGFSMSGGAIA